MTVRLIELRDKNREREEEEIKLMSIFAIYMEINQTHYVSNIYIQHIIVIFVQ